MGKDRFLALHPTFGADTSIVVSARPTA